MLLYFRVLKFEFARYLAYPQEIFFGVAKRLIEILFLLFFWFLVLENNTEGLKIADLASYFLIANAVTTITMAHNTSFGRTIRYTVKNGDISQLFVRPVKVLPYLYARTIGQISIRIVTAFVFLLVGIFLAQPSPYQLLLFGLSFIFSSIIAIAFNIFEGTLAFVITEVSGVKNAIRHISNILSGNMIPLYLFPVAFHGIAFLNPFALMVFIPTQFLLEHLEPNQILIRLGFGLFWSIVTMIGVLLFWKRATKYYEATGI